MTNKTNIKNILITGGSSGIGAALAIHYAAPGIFLAISGRDKSRLHAVAEQCRALGASVNDKIIDVTDRTAMRQWIDDIDAQYPIDLVVANAGISAGTGGAIEGEEQARHIVDINLMGVLNTIHPALDHMIERGYGQIALVSSMAGFRGMPGAPAYCASKAAVKSYGEALRANLADHHIDVNVICPGFVKSRITDANTFKMPFFMTAEKAASIIKAGLEKNKGRIAFPLPTLFGAWVLDALPDGIAGWIAQKTPSK